MSKLIAEFCQNHNGDFELLKKMISAAAEAGASHGKMQTIFANTITYRPQFEEGLIQNGEIKSIKRPFFDEYKRLKDLEISYSNTEKFIQVCKENGLVPMTTCFVREHVNTLQKLGFKSIKIASYDCASFSLLEDISSKFREIIVSTGATYDDEVRYAAKILAKTNFSFLHCVTLYPTPLNQMHMARIDWLRNFTSSVGYSDHSLVEETGLIASKAALALGADIIERHFTILPPESTKDGPVSINKEELNELYEFSKLSISDRLTKMDSDFPKWREVIGDKERVLTEEELLNRDYYRGRFASRRKESLSGTRMIFNWESIPLS